MFKRKVDPDVQAPGASGTGGANPADRWKQ